MIFWEIFRLQYENLLDKIMNRNKNKNDLLKFYIFFEKLKNVLNNFEDCCIIIYIIS